MIALTLLHFNDLHGHLSALPRLFTLLNRERQAALAGGRVPLVLDAGDSSDRHSPESAATQGRANMALLDAMGVQASVLGNNEAKWGRAALTRLVNSAHFPMLCANVHAPDIPALQPWVLLTAHTPAGREVRVGLFGITDWSAPAFKKNGLTTSEPLTAARRALDELTAQGAQVFIALSHLGYGTPADKQKWVHPDDPSDLELAAACPQIHAIVGGHTHTTLFQPVQVGQTLVVQAGCHAQYLGKLELDIAEDGRLTHFAGELIPCPAHTPPDPTLAAIYDLVREETAKLSPPQPTSP